MNKFVDELGIKLQPLLTTTQYYLIASQCFCVETYGSFDVKDYLRSLSHLKIKDNINSKTVSIKLIESKTTWNIPPNQWINWEYINPYNGQLIGFHNGYYAMLNSNEPSFIFIDYEGLTIYYWVNDFSKLPPNERAAPLRSVFNLWFKNTPLFMCHAAGLGFNNKGVLLTGKGGSGKSTSTLSCLQTQLKYAGDDFLLVDSEKHIAYSLYNVAKLNTEQFDNFNHLKQHISNVEYMPREKGHVYINEAFSGEMLHSFLIKSILMPIIRGKKDTYISTCSKIEAIKALIPSSVWILRSDNKSIEKMKNLINSLPTYNMYAGTQLEQISVQIAKHLNEN